MISFERSVAEYFSSKPEDVISECVLFSW